MFITARDKRAFRRMAIDCQVMFQSNQERFKGVGIGKNLSAQGILFLTNRHLPVGTVLEIDIASGSHRTPPFRALMEVVRSELQNRPGEYAVAGRFRKILN